MSKIKDNSFIPGDFVVYPSHGVGKIIGTETREIENTKLELLAIRFEQDRMTLRVPLDKAKVSGLRTLSSKAQMDEAITTLQGKAKVKKLMWSRRAQEYETKISSGKIYELAEVVRDLNKGDDLMVDQSYSERQLFEKAYERILSEFQIVLNVSLEDTQKKLDKALKRNLGGQPQPAAPAKTPTSELPVDEPISDNDEPIDE